MGVSDGRGHNSWAEIEQAAHRPDLPDCLTCENGTACNCAIAVKKGAKPGWCGCMSIGV